MTYLEGKLLNVLQDILQQIHDEATEGAIWDYTVARARNMARQVEREFKADEYVAQGRKILSEMDASKPMPDPAF